MSNLTKAWKPLPKQSPETVYEEIQEYRNTKRKQLLSILPSVWVNDIIKKHDITSKPNTDFKRRAIFANWNYDVKMDILKALEKLL